MKLTNNKALLTICIFILMIQFVSASLAAKPVKPPPRNYSVKYGYAIVEDKDGNLITSDLNGEYEYIDIENVKDDDPIYTIDGVKRGDKIRVLSYDDNGELIWLRAFIGKPELLEGSTGYRSPRRVNFNFDLYDSAITRPGGGTAVYDILSEIRNDDGTYVTRDLTGTVHFVVAIGSCDFFGEDIQNRAMFMIDPGCLAEPPAISQTSVDAFDDDPNNPIYWTAEDGASTTDSDYDAHNQIAYHMLINQLNVAATHFSAGVADTWEITPQPGDVTIQVYEYKNASSNKNRPNYKYVPVSLATYAGKPFKIILSLIPFTKSAPSRQNTAATLWGDVKSQK